MSANLLPLLIGGAGLFATTAYLSTKHRLKRFPAVRKAIGETLALLPAPVRTALGEAWKQYGSCMDRLDKGLARADQDFNDLRLIIFDEIEYGLGLKERPKPPDPNTTLAMCNMCAGTGVVLGGTCPQCEGSKFRRLPKDTVCPECNGGGRQMCKECFGSGYLRCTCGGTGCSVPAAPAPASAQPAVASPTKHQSFAEKVARTRAARNRARRD